MGQKSSSADDEKDRRVRRVELEFRAAIDLEPGSLDAHYRLAQAYTRTGQEALAQHEFEVHDRLLKQQAAETEKQHSEIKQFVYSIKDNPKP